MADPTPLRIAEAVVRGSEAPARPGARGRLWPWVLLVVAVAVLAIAFLAYLPG